MTSPSPLRRDQANAVRERILAAALGVIESGVEPTMRAVANAAGIAERTLYRYFPTREDLLAALIPRLRELASAPMATDIDGLPEYVRTLFTRFAANPRLTRALVTAAWAPTGATRPANLRALQSVIDAGFPAAPKPDRRSAAASLRVLYSAASWVYLCDCGFDLEQGIEHVQWITRCSLDRLKRTRS